MTFSNDFPKVFTRISFYEESLNIRGYYFSSKNSLIFNVYLPANIVTSNVIRESAKGVY